MAAMDERSLILNVSTAFAAMWTEFEMHIADVHRMNGVQQMRAKMLLVDNILWQMLQGSASSKARVQGGDTATLAPQHVYASLERTVSRLGPPAATHAVRGRVVPAAAAPATPVAAPPPPLQPRGGNSPQHIAAPICDCGGALLASPRSYSCTACGVAFDRGAFGAASVSHHHHTHVHTHVSPPRDHAHHAATAARPHLDGPSARALQATLPATGAQTSDPVFDYAGGATRVEAHGTRHQHSPHRRATATPPGAGGTHRHPRLPSDAAAAAAARGDRGRAGSKSHTRKAKHSRGRRLSKAVIEEANLPTVQEGSSKFDFKKAHRDRDSDEEATVGRCPTGSPRDQFPASEGWSRQPDGTWKSWPTLRGERARENSVHARARRYSGESNDDNDHHDRPAELVSATVAPDDGAAAARPSSEQAAPPPPLPPPPPPPPPPPAPVSAAPTRSAVSHQQQHPPPPPPPPPPPQAQALPPPSEPLQPPTPLTTSNLEQHTRRSRSEMSATVAVPAREEPGSRVETLPSSKQRTKNRDSNRGKARPEPAPVVKTYGGLPAQAAPATSSARLIGIEVKALDGRV